jgi:hypothetical protein
VCNIPQIKNKNFIYLIKWYIMTKGKLFSISQI